MQSAAWSHSQKDTARIQACVVAVVPAALQVLQICFVFGVVHVALALNVVAKRFDAFDQVHASFILRLQFYHLRDVLKRAVLVKVGQRDESVPMRRAFSLELVGKHQTCRDTRASSNQSVIAAMQIAAPAHRLALLGVCAVGIAPRTIEAHAHAERRGENIVHHDVVVVYGRQRVLSVPSLPLPQFWQWNLRGRLLS